MAEELLFREEPDGIAGAMDSVVDTNDLVVVPISEEFMTIGKRIEQTGTVRVDKRTVETSENLRFDLVQETVSIEHVPINRQVDEAPVTRQEGDTTIIPVLEEVVVVEKRLMLREEIRLTRTRTTVPKEQTVVLRKEEATVERIETER